jgi:hypothetical protein
MLQEKVQKVREKGNSLLFMIGAQPTLHSVPTRTEEGFYVSMKEVPPHLWDVKGISHILIKCKVSLFGLFLYS